MSAQPLLLLGCGGFGRELAAWIAARAMPYDVIGFLDDENPQAAGVIGPIRGHEPQAGVLYLTCFGDGQARHRIRTQFETRGARFATLISPDAMAATALNGHANSTFLGACSISSGVTLEEDLLIQGFAVVGHDVSIRTGVTISSHAFIGGFAKLEPFCTIHPHAVILPHVIVGEGAVVGAGTVVIKDVPPGATVFGVPARVIVPGTTQ